MVCALAFQPAASWALDAWTEPYPGIRYLQRTTPGPASFRVLIFDLTRDVQMRATPAGERWQKTSDYAGSAKLAIAVNGGPWDAFTQKAKGLAAGGGETWSRADGRHGAFGVTRDGRAIILAAADISAAPPDLIDGVSGRPTGCSTAACRSELLGVTRYSSSSLLPAMGTNSGRPYVSTP